MRRTSVSVRLKNKLKDKDENALVTFFFLSSHSVIRWLQPVCVHDVCLHPDRSCWSDFTDGDSHTRDEEQVRFIHKNK